LHEKTGRWYIIDAQMLTRAATSEALIKTLTILILKTCNGLGRSAI
jgi:hypothetical protein